jgi:hypothetical protein
MDDNLIGNFDESAANVLLQAQGSESCIPECFAALSFVENGSRNEGGDELQVAEQSFWSNICITEKVLEDVDDHVGAGWVGEA